MDVFYEDKIEDENCAEKIVESCITETIRAKCSENDCVETLERISKMTKSGWEIVKLPKKCCKVTANCTKDYVATNCKKFTVKESTKTIKKVALMKPESKWILENFPANYASEAKVETTKNCSEIIHKEDCYYEENDCLIKTCEKRNGQECCISEPKPGCVPSYKCKEYTTEDCDIVTTKTPFIYEKICEEPENEPVVKLVCKDIISEAESEIRTTNSCKWEKVNPCSEKMPENTEKPTENECDPLDEIVCKDRDYPHNGKILEVFSCEIEEVSPCSTTDQPGKTLTKMLDITDKPTNDGTKTTTESIQITEEPTQ